MRHTVDVAHVALAEGGSGTVGSAQHLTTRLGILPVMVGSQQVFMDELYGLDGHTTCVSRGAASDEGLHGMYQGIHARGGGDVRG